VGKSLKIFSIIFKLKIVKIITGPPNCRGRSC